MKQGDIVNSIELLSITDKKSGSNKVGVFKCKCGKEFEARISYIKLGHTKSCGCSRKKLTPEQRKNSYANYYSIYE